MGKPAVGKGFDKRGEVFLDVAVLDLFPELQLRLHRQIGAFGLVAGAGYAAALRGVGRIDRRFREGLVGQAGTARRLVEALHQRIDKVARGQIAFIAPLGERLFDDRVPHRRQGSVELRRWHRVLGQDFLRDRMTAAGERPRAGEKLIQDHAAGKQVGAAVYRQPLVLLRRHVGRGADFGADLRQHGRLDLGDAKVGHLDVTVVGDHDVGRFDVPVYHLIAVGVVERAQNFAHDANDFLEFEFLGLIEIFFQFLAAQVLHRDIGDVVGLAIVVDRAHARMVEPAGCLGFLLETVEQIFRLGGVERVFDHRFDRNTASDHRVAAIVDGTHRARAEDSNHVVLAKIFWDDHFQANIIRMSGSTP